MIILFTSHNFNLQWVKKNPWNKWLINRGNHLAGHDLNPSLAVFHDIFLKGFSRKTGLIPNHSPTHRAFWDVLGVIMSFVDICCLLSLLNVVIQCVLRVRWVWVLGWVVWMLKARRWTQQQGNLSRQRLHWNSKNPQQESMNMETT